MEVPQTLNTLLLTTNNVALQLMVTKENFKRLSCLDDLDIWNTLL